MEISHHCCVAYKVVAAGADIEGISLIPLFFKCSNLLIIELNYWILSNIRRRRRQNADMLTGVWGRVHKIF